MGEDIVSLRDAVFWLNIHLELLAANQRALRRLRALVVASSRQPQAYAPDFQLLSGEARRLLGRIAYWEEMIDNASGADRLRPILAGFGVKELGSQTRLSQSGPAGIANSVGINPEAG